MTASAPLRPSEPRIAWTPRQREVLDLLVEGRTNGEIAETLGITLDGAKWHMREILGKLGVESREEAADYWRRERRRAFRPGRRTFAWLGLGLAAAGSVAAAITAVSFAFGSAGGTGTDDPELPAAIASITPGPGEHLYAVEPGDSCASIAATYQITVDDLRAANPAIDPECTNLVVGQVLVIGSGTTAPTITSTPFVGNVACLDPAVLAPLRLEDGSLVFGTVIHDCVGWPASLTVTFERGKSGIPLAIDGNGLNAVVDPTARDRVGSVLPLVRWSNWCGDTAEGYMFTLDAGGASSGGGSGPYPACTNPDAPSRLETLTRPPDTDRTCAPGEVTAHTAVDHLPPQTRTGISVAFAYAAPCSLATWLEARVESVAGDVLDPGYPLDLPSNGHVLGVVYFTWGCVAVVESRLVVEDRGGSAGPVLAPIDPIPLPLPATSCPAGSNTQVRPVVPFLYTW